MNVLFLTLVEFESLQARNIYTDLLREFVKNGHKVYAISPVEKRRNIETHMVNEDHARILRLQIGNTQKTNVIEKGISTLCLEPQFKAGIKKYFSDVRFDLVLYSTPPITLLSAIEYVKKRDGARTYLLLKDIFPQNAVDIGLMSTKGLKGLLYKYFRNQEKKLYAVSDRIGCMSPANVEYILDHNPEVKKRDGKSQIEIGKGIVEVSPNSVEVVDKSVDENIRIEIREKYDIPLDKKVFVYGGNLGKPQGIPFLIECMNKCTDIEDVYFLIVGDGTEYGVLEEYVKSSHQRNLKLMKRLPKEDYDTMVAACDVGMIFLDHRFAIPNFPSRLLSYMAAKLPVLAATDPNTDIGNIITGVDKKGVKFQDAFGWWCQSNSSQKFVDMVKKISVDNECREMGDKAFAFLSSYYDVSLTYAAISKWVIEK